MGLAYPPQPAGAIGLAAPGTGNTVGAARPTRDTKRADRWARALRRDLPAPTGALAAWVPRAMWGQRRAGHHWGFHPRRRAGRERA